MTARRVALVILAVFAVAAVLSLALYGPVSWRWKKTASHNSSVDDGDDYDADVLICHLEMTLMSLNNGGDEEDCECAVVSRNEEEMKVSDMAVAIDLPADFLNQHKRSLMNGSLYVKIPGGFVEEDYIVGFGAVGTKVFIPEGSEIQVLNSTEVDALKHHHGRSRRHRRDMESEVGLIRGTRSVMVFRVTTDDASPIVGASEIEERMFSTRSFSFASQFDSCSFGELKFQPFDYRFPVTELYVSGETSYYTERTILNAATKAVKELYGTDIFDRVDHAVFCMPDGTSGKPYIAYSGVGSFFSVFHDARCAYPTTVMHELAHNLGESN